MVDVVLKLRADKVKLLNPNISVAPSNYITLQLKSKNESARDRSADIQEFDSIVELSDYEKMNASDCKSITELIELLKGSRKHISIDSGTAWLAAAMGLDTVVLSKNSYYFSDAYHYMRYLNIQKNVKVHQQNNSGVKIPSEEEYTRLATSNGVFKPYSQYLSEVKRI
jgi:ADP-heptose:LPS heptosyltransferase